MGARVNGTAVGAPPGFLSGVGSGAAAAACRRRPSALSELQTLSVSCGVALPSTDKVYGSRGLPGNLTERRRSARSRLSRRAT